MSAASLDSSFSTLFDLHLWLIFFCEGAYCTYRCVVLSGMKMCPNGVSLACNTDGLT